MSKTSGHSSRRAELAKPDRRAELKGEYERRETDRRNPRYGCIARS